MLSSTLSERGAALGSEPIFEPDPLGIAAAVPFAPAQVLCCADVGPGHDARVVVGSFETAAEGLRRMHGLAGDRLRACASAAAVPDAGERVSLQLAFGSHLREVRARALGGDPGPPAVLDREPEPEVLPHTTPFPHLALLSTAEGIRDVVLWEAIDRALLVRLIGRDEFDLDYWRSRFGGLVALKSALRHEGERGERLRRLEHALGDRYLSFRFVLQNEDLLRSVVEEAP